MPNASLRVSSFKDWAAASGAECSIADLAQVYCRVFHYPPVKQEWIAQMIYQELQSGYEYLVLLHGGILTGFVAYRYDIRQGDVLVELFHIGNLVTPATAGGGCLLIQAMENDIRSSTESCAENHLHCVYLRTHATNASAQRFYRRCGFWLVAMLPHHFHRGVDELIFQKLYQADPSEQAHLERWSAVVGEQLAVFHGHQPTARTPQ